MVGVAGAAVGGTTGSRGRSEWRGCWASVEAMAINRKRATAGDNRMRFIETSPCLEKTTELSKHALLC
jgi:hypothetical protein